MVSLLILGTVSCQYDDTEKLFKIFSQNFLRRIAALFYDKNGENVPEGCHKGLLKKF